MTGSNKFRFRDRQGQRRDRCSVMSPIRSSFSSHVAALVAAVVLVGACSSSDDSGPGTEPPVGGTETATSDSSATTQRSTTTEVEATPAPTTKAPPATAATTEAPAGTQAPTTPAPTTTAAPAPVEVVSEAGAAAAVNDFFDLWTDCLAAMPACDAAAISGNYVGELSDNVFLQARSWVDGGFSFTNTESRENSIETVELDLDAGTATVTTCEIDGAVQRNSSGEIVDDEFQSLKRRWTLVTDGTRWLGSELLDLEVASGEENNLCA